MTLLDFGDALENELWHDCLKHLFILRVVSELIVEKIESMFSLSVPLAPAARLKFELLPGKIMDDLIIEQLVANVICKHLAVL